MDASRRSSLEEKGVVHQVAEHNPQPCRVIIRTRVTNIGGPPADRVRNLGQIFCSHVLGRQLRHRPDDEHAHDGEPFDAIHFLPLCDSPHPVHAWFMYDLDFDGRSSAAQDLAQIPHEVYLGSLIDGRWYGIRPTLHPVQQYEMLCRCEHGL